MYSIGEFSRMTGLSIHTLRYYEHEGLIKPKRNDKNRRLYSENEIEWVKFIKRLKNTGMPIHEISYYAKLRSKGNASLKERLEMLIQHRKNLNQKLEVLNENLVKLDEKINFYKSLI